MENHRQPLTPQQFRDRWQIGKSKYHELINTGKLKQTVITPRVIRVLPEDEDAFIASCRKSATA